MRRFTLVLASLLLIFLNGGGDLKAQVAPQLSTDETVYAYNIQFGSGQWALLNGTGANVTFGVNKIDLVEFKIVETTVEGYTGTDKLVKLIPTNKTGYEFPVSPNATNTNQAVLYRNAEVSGNLDVWVLFDNGDGRYRLKAYTNETRSFTAWSSGNVGVWAYDASNGAGFVKFWPANANAVDGVDLESGYYRIRNVQKSTKYLKNDVVNNADNKTLQSSVDATKLNNNFIWKVDVDGIQITLLNGQGTPLKVDNLTYPTMAILKRMEEKTYVFDNYLNRNNANNDNVTLHTYPTDGTTDANQWAFEKVEGTPYFVVLENERPGSRLKQVSTNGEAFEGGFFFVEAGVTAEELQADLVSGYDECNRTPVITIDGTTITATYPQDEAYKLTLLDEKINEYETAITVFGTTPGFYDEAKFDAAIAKAQELVAAGAVGNTPESVDDAMSTLDAEVAASQIKVTPGIYMIVSGFSNFHTNQGMEKAMLSNNGLRWANLDASNPAQYWIVEAIEGDDNAFYVRNYADGKCMQGTNSLSATSKSKVTFDYTYTNGKLQINVGGHNDLHANGHSSGNGASSNIIGHNSGSNNDASCWLIRPADETLLSAIKVYTKNERVATLVAGTKYMIFNTADGRYGWLYNDEDALKVNKILPAAMTESYNSYLWTLEAVEGKWYIKSELTGKYVNIAGAVTSTDGVALNISDFSGYAHKADIASVNDDGTTTAANNISASNKVFAIHLDEVDATNNTGCWNGTSNGKFDDLETAHPYAFYTVNEVTHTEDEIKALRGQADELLAKDGVGYPTDNERAALQRVMDNGFYNAMANAISSYKTTTEVKMPEVGKAYRIKNIKRHATDPILRTVYMTSATAKAMYVEGDEQGAAEIFVCTEDANGRISFYNAQYGSLISCRGVQANYNANIAAFDLISMNDRTFDGLKPPFGGLFFHTTSRKANGGGSAGSLIAYYGSETFRAEGDATDAFYDTDYSSIYLLEEVSYPNTPNISAQIGEDFVGTFAAPFPTVVPEDVEAYAITGQSGDYAALSEPIASGNAIPAGEGVLLVSKSAKSNVVMAPRTTETITELTGNLLERATGEAISESTTAYILADGSNGVGFYLLGDKRTVKMNKAYLTGLSSGAVLKLNFGGNLTGIDSIDNGELTIDNGTVYDLSGRVVNAPVKGGIYIKNGKKYIVK